MPMKSKVFIQTLQKSPDRHEISFAFEFYNKNTKKVFGANLPPIQLSWIYPPIQLGLMLIIPSWQFESTLQNILSGK